MQKRFRVYFNRKREAPQVWSIDEGSQDSEVNLTAFVIGPGCISTSRYSGEPANDDSPSAWIEVLACGFEVTRGAAYFFGNHPSS
jgi:hypothetical protein